MCAASHSLSHAEILKIYGISRSKIQASMLNDTMIPRSITPALDLNICKLFNGEYFLSQVFDGKFPFYQQDYTIIYQSCTPAIARKSDLVVYFRVAKPELGIEPICIVKVMNHDRASDSNN